MKRDEPSGARESEIVDLWAKIFSYDCVPKLFMYVFSIAKYVAFLEASFGIEEVLILPSLASSARMGSGPVFRTENGK